MFDYSIMNEALFHTSLRNVGLFITLSFVSLTYVKTKSGTSARRIILSMGMVFLAISYILNSRIMKQKNNIDSSLQRISKLIFIIHIILLTYILNLLIFKKMN